MKDRPYFAPESKQEATKIVSIREKGKKHRGVPMHLKGRFLEFRMYHSFTNLFSILSESTFTKEISKFQ